MSPSTPSNFNAPHPSNIVEPPINTNAGERIVNPPVSLVQQPASVYFTNQEQTQ